ncbi:MAG: DNA polymerase III subunit gamma/tau [Clostridiales bacterium]|nr:DNA polymerase III subunit gamma/tau [Clostridiales bacterium]
MDYIALYRKYRPQTFDDVIGQENITDILKHQIKNSQVGHAYLFCGGRGTGKTSTAKIFARAVNCTVHHEGEPCNNCDICNGILSSSIVDVQEIDAASNNGVENIRAIREDVMYAPAITKYKVYIIDEVHMLSSGAFNALLKTLEEPPKHVIFILATTEPHKLPVTILSRCQRFEFKRISINNIVKRLSFICKENNVTYSDSALSLIAQSADGAMRDALSLLDQILSSGLTNIDDDSVKMSLGIPSLTSAFNVITALLNNDITPAISTSCDIINDGKDIKYFIWQIISLTRDALVYKVSANISILNNYSALNEIKELSKFDNNKLEELIILFSELENKVKFSSFPNILLETEMIKFCTEPKNVVKTIIKEEKPIIQKTSPSVASETVKTQHPSPAPSTTATKTLPTFNNWSDVLNSLKSSGKVLLYGALANAKVQVNEHDIIINFENSFSKTLVEKPENFAVLKNILNSSGKNYNIICELIGANTANTNSPISDLEKQIQNFND